MKFEQLDHRSDGWFSARLGKPTASQFGRIITPKGALSSQADLYEAENKPELAKKVYATLKDKDAKGPAGMIAAQKLNPAPAAGAPPALQ